MQTIGDRIRLRRETLNMSQDELAKKLGYKSRSSINKIESGERNLTQSKIKQIADALETDPAYIMGWTDNTASQTESKETRQKYHPTRYRYPILGDIAAGVPILTDDHIEEYIEITKDVKADFALRVKGDSMTGANIYDGDIVFIREQSVVEDGEIAAIVLIDSYTSDAVATLKRVYKTPEGYQLVSENRKYAPIAVTKDNFDGARIIGKATYYISKVK